MRFIVIEVMTMKTVQITFEDGVHAKAKAVALAAKMTLGDLVRAAVEAHVERLEAEAQRTEKGGRQ